MTKSGLIQAIATKMPHLPARDVEEFGVTIKMPVGTKLEETSRVVAQLELCLAALREAQL